MKKFFTLILAIVATTSLWAYDFKSGDLYYNITSNTTVEVTYQYEWSYNNYAGLTTATIPETVIYDGTTYSVTSIGDDAFLLCSALTSITIPNSVTSIGDRAFSGCSSLPVDNNLRYADTYLVEAVDKTLSTYSIKEGTKWIGYSAFYNCSSLTSVTIPNSVTSIGYRAFYFCSALTSITIPNSVTSIGDEAFYYCSALTSITIPNSVTSIGSSAFRDCSSLTSITIPNSVTSIGSFAFAGTPLYNNLSDGVIYLGKVLYKYKGTMPANTNITIEDGTVSISPYAFQDCSSLTSITIPNSVTSIGSSAFRDCSSLTSFTIPNSVTSIGDAAFINCNSLSSITIPNSVTFIGKYAFQDCSSLISVTIPNSVTSIENGAFQGCSSLTSITIPNSVTFIGKEAFDGCSSLTSITIPNSVTSIGDEAFYYCSALTSVTIPKSVKSIGTGVSRGCNSLVSIAVEEGNTIYDSRENCNAIVETATNTLIAGCQNTIIPNSVTSIGDWAFYGCSSLTSITIPNSVTSIGVHAFTYCRSLTSIIIPNSVTSIRNGAFAWCSALTTVICKAIEVPELILNVFNRMPLSEATLYVPAESIENYKSAEQWKDFGTILPIEGESEEEVEFYDTEMTIVFTNSEDNDREIYRQTITIKVPTAPTIAGFTFLYWQTVAEPITNEITIQAIYEADTPTSADVYTNPANPTQKLLRNGQVYILQNGKTYTVMGAEVK